MVNHVAISLIYIVQCPQLPNGTIKCLNGSTIGMYEDTCTFSCDDGFQLRGSHLEECLDTGKWSGANATCVLG